MDNYEFKTEVIDGIAIVFSRMIGKDEWKEIPHSEIHRGTEVEMEHASTIKKIIQVKPSIKVAATMIALDHLAERGDYYDRLEEVEGGDKMPDGGQVKEMDAKTIALNHLSHVANRYGHLDGDAEEPIEELSTGGEVDGKSHIDGGEKFEVGHSGEVVELEGEEVVINKANMKDDDVYEIKGNGTLKEFASLINEHKGNGVSFAGTQGIEIRKIR